MLQYFFQSRKADSLRKTDTFLKVSKSMQQYFFQIRKDSFRKMPMEKYNFFKLSFQYQTIKTFFHIFP